jgi:hypothetical protein
MASSSASAASAATASAEPLEVPPLPPKLRGKPQQRGNIGAGKLYADEAAFLADVEAWKLERAERVALVKERERMQERLRERNRDRSGRQRDAEHETDGERRVRQRRESAAQSAAHVDDEAARRQARRQKQQEAWVHDVGAFAAMFDGFLPRHWIHDTPMSISDAVAKGLRPQHPFAYNGFRNGTWLRDGTQILELHGFMRLHPPSGDNEWEHRVDECARRLWRAPEASAAVLGSDWHPSCHPGDGYCMLLSLPSALPSMRASEAVKVLLKQRQRLISPGNNDELARRGFEPLPGWEPLVEAGYMPPPKFLELSADEIRRRRARFFFEEAFASTPTQFFPTTFIPGRFDTGILPGIRSHAAWKELHADEICALPGCRFQVCRCRIGVVLDASGVHPLEPKRAARLENC